MGTEPADSALNGLTTAVRGLEISLGRVGAMIQGQQQQETSTAGLVAKLQVLLRHLVTDTLATRERVDALSILLEARLPLADTPLVPPSPFVSETFVTVRPLGALANRMIQHMVAMSIAARVPGATIARVHLPEWGYDEPEPLDVPEPDLVIDTMRVDVGEVAARMRRGEARTVALSGFVQNVANFLEPDVYRHAFTGPLNVLGFGPKVLLIVLRMDEILSGDYPPYVLLPPAFYRQLIVETGLKPVFFGQITPSPYLDELKATFPDARFVRGKNPIHDFQTIRHSRNIVVGAGTFAWLAAWLSTAQRVFLPLAGLFNPIFAATYGCGQDFVPRDDARYRLYLFPFGVAAGQEETPAYHAAIDGTWRKITSAEVDELLDGRRLTPRSLANHLALLDEEYYLATYPEIAQAVASGSFRSGRDHYERQGFSEGRLPFAVDPYYAVHYSDAGLAISNGEFADLHHFHAERGHAFGYLPTRQAADAPPQNVPARVRRVR